jgi:hypothetical protein
MLGRLGLVAIMMAAAACGSSTSTKTVTVTSGQGSGGGSTGTTESTPPAVTPDPNGKVSGICDYSLGSGTGTDYSFIADVTIENTGNVGIVATAKAVFNQLGSAPVVVKRAGVHIAIGRSKTVHLKRTASPSEIDLHQSANSKCSTDATITDTFGAAQ